jgi:hypothetical protein
MGATLLVGMLLARAKRFAAHGFCQSTVVVFNLAPILLFMFPGYRAAAKHLVESLDKFKVPEREKSELLAFVSSLKKDIVDK